MDVAPILLVDDDQLTLDALMEAVHLRLYRTAVVMASTGEEALARITATDFDAVVTDVKMPGMDGWALLAEIHHIRPTLPVVVMSGHVDDLLASTARTHHAFAFLGKPLNREQLTVWLKRAIEVSHLRKAVEAQRITVKTYARELEAVEERTHELHEHEQFLNAVIDSAPCLLILTDPEGRVVLFNRQAETLTGYRRDEVIGQSVDQFMPASWQAIVRERFANPLLPAIRAQQYPLMLKSGNQQIIEWRWTPFFTKHDARPCLLSAGTIAEEQEHTL